MKVLIFLGAVIFWVKCNVFISDGLPVAVLACHPGGAHPPGGAPAEDSTLDTTLSKVSNLLLTEHAL